jgi:hypothetical protein
VSTIRASSLAASSPPLSAASALDPASAGASFAGTALARSAVHPTAASQAQLTPATTPDTRHEASTPQTYATRRLRATTRSVEAT